VLPRTHLNSPDEFLIDNCLLIKMWKESAEMFTNEMWLVTSGCVECGERQPTNILKEE